MMTFVVTSAALPATVAVSGVDVELSGAGIERFAGQFVNDSGLRHHVLRRAWLAPGVVFVSFPMVQLLLWFGGIASRLVAIFQDSLCGFMQFAFIVRLCVAGFTFVAAVRVVAGAGGGMEVDERA
ncbi:hypothetical protein JNUCC0626_48555 [Lentzea sp. JNUCC 0626]|uniref:hypothetical protein n=1 Tax=Lentzea sp. JNUCC 0626 TaxID=3367513 RepID=UPI00374786F8